MENSVEKERSSIEETIKIIERKIKEAEHYSDITGLCLTLDEELRNSLMNILSDYKRVLKENEELKRKNNAIKRESEAYAENMIRLDNELNLEKEKSKYEWIRQNCLPQELVNKLYIPIQKIKDKIEELNKKEQELQNSVSNEEREEYSDANISWNLMDIEIRREVLQELLEGEK